MRSGCSRKNRAGRISGKDLRNEPMQELRQLPSGVEAERRMDSESEAETL
jgi:hypothetical protein